ncbi:hypothetical protein KR054_010461, partial [Drosophila jambulina]
IQAVSIEISTRRGRFNVASVYCPPAFRWTEADFTTFLSNLGDKFLAAGDWNAKHRWWGNHRMCAIGRTLSSVLANVNVDIVATGEATCYPYRANATPSTIDFGISKGFRQQQVSIRVLTELSSDHLPLLFLISEEAQFHKGVPKLLPAHADVATKNIDTLLEGGGPDNCRDFSIWKLTRGIKRQPLVQSPIQSHSGHWLKTDSDKANAFAEHLSATFTPFDLPDAFHRDEVANFLSAPIQPARPIRHTTP